MSYLEYIHTCDLGSEPALKEMAKQTNKKRANKKKTYTNKTATVSDTLLLGIPSSFAKFFI